MTLKELIKKYGFKEFRRKCWDQNIVKKTTYFRPKAINEPVVFGYEVNAHAYALEGEDDWEIYNEEQNKE